MGDAAAAFAAAQQDQCRALVRAGQVGKERADKGLGLAALRCGQCWAQADALLGQQAAIGATRLQLHFMQGQAGSGVAAGGCRGSGRSRQHRPKQAAQVGAAVAAGQQRLAVELDAARRGGLEARLSHTVAPAAVPLGHQPRGPQAELGIDGQTAEHDTREVAGQHVGAGQDLEALRLRAGAKHQGKAQGRQRPRAPSRT